MTKKQTAINENTRWDYRLMEGSSWEGFSLREVFYDDKDNIIGWTPHPVMALAPNKEDITKEIIKAMQDLDDMLEGMKKPILDESALEISTLNQATE